MCEVIMQKNSLRGRILIYSGGMNELKLYPR